MIQLKSKSQSVVILSILGLLISILLVILVLVPQFSNLKNLSDSANQKQEQLKLGREKVQSIKDGVNLINNSSQIISSLGVAVPKTPEAENALLQLSNAAAASGVAISGVSVSEASKGALMISFSTTGAYDKTVDFISKVESNLRPVEFNDYTIGTSTDASNLSSTFNLSFPYLKEAETSTSPTTQAQSDVSSADENGGGS